MIERKLDILNIDDTLYETAYTAKFLKRKSFQRIDKRKITAFIPGVIQEVFVRQGDIVKEGDKLLVLEAMKMKNSVNSPFSGKIKSLHVKAGKIVAKNELLLEIE